MLLQFSTDLALCKEKAAFYPKKQILAEDTGFEPVKRLLPYRISSAALSTGLSQSSFGLIDGSIEYSVAQQTATYNKSE